MRIIKGLLLKLLLNLLDRLLKHQGNSLIIGGPMGWNWQSTIDDSHHGARGSGLHADSHARQHDHSLSADGSPIALSGVPDLPADKITSGTFGVARGGTGLSSIDAGGILYASAANVLSRIAPTAANQVLRSTAANALQIASLTAGDIPNLDASKITSGRFEMARMPDGTSGYFLKAQGAGNNPAYAEIPVDPDAGTAGLRTLGTGAQQAAAGNHTHTLVDDKLGSQFSSLSVGYGATLYYYYSTVRKGTETELASTTVSFASSSRAVIHGVVHAALAYNANLLKLRLYVGGILKAESGYLGTTPNNYIISHIGAYSGSTSIVLKVANVGTSDTIIYINYLNGTGYTIAASINYGSVKL